MPNPDRAAVERMKQMHSDLLDLLCHRPPLSVYLNHDEYKRDYKKWASARNCMMAKLVDEIPALLSAWERAEAMREALEMVRDADDDARADGLPTIPSPARGKIDAALAEQGGGHA